MKKKLSQLYVDQDSTIETFNKAEVNWNRQLFFLGKSISFYFLKISEFVQNFFKSITSNHMILMGGFLATFRRNPYEIQKKNHQILHFLMNIVLSSYKNKFSHTRVFREKSFFILFLHISVQFVVWVSFFVISFWFLLWTFHSTQLRVQQCKQNFVFMMFKFLFTEWIL